jgi:hypothetical protein
MNKSLDDLQSADCREFQREILEELGDEAPVFLFKSGE